MSSILGCVAAVIAMVSPSQPRPAVIHRTSISEIGAGLRSRPGAVPIAPSFWASNAREARPASVHNKRVQLVARTHHDILAPIQLVSDRAVRYRSAEIGMPKRLAGGGIQRHQVVVWVAGKHQVPGGAQQPAVNSGRLPLMAPLDFSSAIVQRLQHRLVPVSQFIPTPPLRLVAIVKNVIHGKRAS